MADVFDSGDLKLSDDDFRRRHTLLLFYMEVFELLAFYVEFGASFASFYWFAKVARLFLTLVLGDDVDERRKIMLTDVHN